MAGRPTLFTDNVVKRMKMMTADGENAATIAMAVGSTPKSVRVTCAKLGIRLRTRNRYRLACLVTPEMGEVFHKAARDRGLSVQQLLHLLLKNIAEDDLFNAVIK